MQTSPEMPAVPPMRRARRIVPACPAALLCALVLCAPGQPARAQAAGAIPNLSDIPFVRRLFIKTQDAAENAPKTLLVTLDAKNASLGAVIEMLMEQAHASYILSQELTSIPVGTVKLRKVPFDAALRTVLKMAQGRATYRMEDGIYQIVKRQEAETETPNAVAPSPAKPAAEPENGVQAAKAGMPAETPSGAEPRFSLNMKNAPLYQALKQLFEQARLNFSLMPMTRDYRVTVNLRNQPFRVALDTLLKASGQSFSYRVENGVYEVFYHDAGRPEGVK